MAKTIQWTDENVSKDGRFQINAITQVSGDAAGTTEWFLSEGPLKQAPAPCESLEEAKALAVAIANGAKTFGSFEAERTGRRAERMEAARAERRRQSYSVLLDDPEFIAAMRDRLAQGDG